MNEIRVPSEDLGVRFTRLRDDIASCISDLILILLADWVSIYDRLYSKYPWSISQTETMSVTSFAGPEWALAKRRCCAGGDPSRGDLR